MWYQIREQKILLFVKAKPRARKTALLGCKANYLEISLQAQPVDGNANQALIGFLAELFNVPRRDINIAHGLHGRVKRIILPYQQSVIDRLEVLQQQVNRIYS